jgi:hypothetical protein
MGKRRDAYRSLVRKSKGMNDLEEPGIDWRIILK